ncbi:hypothetical protein [Amycolatopsis lurida]|uniref:Uncharacterized protein n=1 Tax=Amycolatopsis lurida NRRL 2430 TaxID=1460371 RepID=A0A2P2FUA4_AMYLU|nr:hypothetical protein [Amycolatopsis lurida]KFU80279.1 hypothetical protein BB31_15755 [Amycolatopsis lurida NRRL 2430]
MRPRVRRIGTVPVPNETALRGLLSTGPAAAAIAHAGLAQVTETIAESIAPYRRSDGSYLLYNTCFTIIATLT